MKLAKPIELDIEVCKRCITKNGAEKLSRKAKRLLKDGIVPCPEIGMAQVGSLSLQKRCPYFVEHLVGQDSEEEQQSAIEKRRKALQEEAKRREAERDRRKWF